MARAQTYSTNCIQTTEQKVNYMSKNNDQQFHYLPVGTSWTKM